MPTAEGALSWLRENLGTAEHPDGSNHNFITEWAGLGDVAWCAETVSRALNEAWGDPDRWQVPGVKADFSWGTAYVPNLRRHFIDADMYHDTPRVGDVVIYAWDPGEPIGDHTGIVEQVVGDGTIVAIEGNADNLLTRKRRTIAAICDGFGRPPYDTESRSDDDTESRSDDDTFRYIFNGQDFVFPGPSGGDVFATSTDGQLAGLNAAGMKAIGEVDADAHTMFQALAKGPPGQ